MDIEVEIKEDFARLVPGEDLDLTTAGDLKEEFTELVENGQKNIVIDFERVRRIDSSGIGKILLFQKILKEEQGSLKITNINSEYVREVFEMVHLDELVDVQ
ncbi:STAS domain-containing protein [Halarsenatibacter silvermanii]|uniref:Anti-sigma B factor antagonist n=1 Tax=Halarsenatibacter silvermanii TaxID=321763 RepID=A0A1G9IZE0_9FIRM|nr:STAS domain-containing protein [Halarsenatibacter silvermanii]SDL30638.1 anti-sigma B factor antagonist [Halarsenatibacter silvermanii]